MRHPTRQENDAYIVCVGLPVETVAQVVHTLGGQHAVLVAPDSAHALRILPTPVGGTFPVAPTRPEPIVRGPLVLDLAAREVRVRNTDVHLSAQEFDLLATLASHPSRVWTFAELTAHVWGTAYLGDPDTVTSAIKRLRRRIPRLRGLEIASVRGIGYRLRVPE